MTKQYPRQPDSFYDSIIAEMATHKIPKKDLVDGAYYAGHCRNANVARWNEGEEMFYHWQREMGFDFVERIRHIDDEPKWDAFTPIQKIDDPPKNIPFIDYHKGK